MIYKEKSTNDKTKCISPGFRVFSAILCLLAIGLAIYAAINNPKLQEFITIKKHEKMQFIWPDSKMAALLPKPQSTTGWIGINNDQELIVEVYKTSEEDFWDYKNKCRTKSHGFNLFQVRENNSYKAYDWEGYYLDLSYDSKKQMLKLHVLEPEEVRVLRGIEHYELEYRSHYNPEDVGSKEYQNYDNVLNKYIIPVRTSIGELYKDFPKEKSNNTTMRVVSIPPRIVNLEEDQDIWVYATYLDNHVCDDIRFTYDTLNVSSNAMEIETHFELIRSIPSSAGECRIIVLSIIPVNQHSDNMYNQSSEDIDDLVYYGKSAIQLYKGSNMIIRLAFLDDYDSLKSVCVYNCQTKQEVQLPISDEVRYTAEDNGFYYIYAIKDDGDFVDLSNRIGIEHAYTTDDEFIMD